MFSARRATRAYDQEALQAQLYQQIGQLKVELDWLKKQLASSLETKRGLIDPDHRQMSVVRPCELVGLSRSSFDDVAHEASPEHLRFMRWLDEPYTRTPFDGVRRMTAW
jgi:putative transposase